MTCIIELNLWNFKKRKLWNFLNTFALSVTKICDSQ